MKRHEKPPPLPEGAIVEHKDLPGTALVVVSGPHEGISGERYIVRMPDKREVPVLRKNLIL